jgi:hypothetical protein
VKKNHATPTRRWSLRAGVRGAVVLGLGCFIGNVLKVRVSRGGGWRKRRKVRGMARWGWRTGEGGWEGRQGIAVACRPWEVGGGGLASGGRAVRG